MKKAIGYISYTHGLDGKIKIVPAVSREEFEKHVSNNEIMLNGTIVDEDGVNKPLQMSIFAFNGKSFICKVKGINDIQNATKLTKHEIFVNASADDDYIDPEFLLNFDVFITTKKKKYGKIVDFGNYGSGNLIKVRTTEGRHEFYFCNKRSIVRIDEQAKSVTIKTF